MTTSASRYVLWLARDDSGEVTDDALRARADVGDLRTEVRTRTLRGFDMESIPAGCRDEWGTKYDQVLNVSANQLPPEGRVFVVDLG